MFSGRSRGPCPARWRRSRTGRPRRTRLPSAMQRRRRPSGPPGYLRHQVRDLGLVDGRGAAGRLRRPGCAAGVGARRRAVDDGVGAEGDRDDGDDADAADARSASRCWARRGVAPTRSRRRGRRRRASGAPLGCGPLRVGAMSSCALGVTDRVEGREVLGVGLALDRGRSRRPSSSARDRRRGGHRDLRGGAPAGRRCRRPAGYDRRRTRRAPEGRALESDRVGKGDVRRIERRDLGVSPAADLRGRSGEVVAHGLVEVVDVLGGGARREAELGQQLVLGGGLPRRPERSGRSSRALPGDARDVGRAQGCEPCWIPHLWPQGSRPDT